MQNIWQHIYAAFIEADRWKLYLKGLGVTLEVSFFAALLGILIGTIAAFLKFDLKQHFDDDIPEVANNEETLEEDNVMTSEGMEGFVLDEDSDDEGNMFDENSIVEDNDDMLNFDDFGSDEL